jgi:hypothetical protein
MKVNELVETASFVSNRRCKHVGLRTFTFSDRHTIRYCPRCTRFDQHRREVLCPPATIKRGTTR